MPRRFAALLGLWLLCACALAAVPERPRFRIIGAAQGLPSTEIRSLARDADGRLTAVDDRAARTRESMMHVAVDRQADAARLQAIADGLQAVLADVRIAVADWAPTVARARAAAARLASGIPGVWVNAGHGASGWALACGSARLLADRIAGAAPTMELDAFSASRFHA